MVIKFEKWHGSKNDFVVTWMVSTDKDTVFESLRRLAPSICARDGGGIGADGILVIETATRKDVVPVALHIVNSDGSLAENCGNGLRCAAMSARLKANRDLNQEIEGVSFNVLGRSIDCRFIGKTSRPLAAISMPFPTINETNPWHTEAIAAYKSLAASIPKLNGDITTVGIGNPHIVAIVEEGSSDLARKAGGSLQSIRGGDGINVHIAHVENVTDKDRQQAKAELGEPISELYRVWPWERGAGATQACGTGACAVALAAYNTGTVNRSSWVAIEMPGGRVYTRQSSEDEPVILAGPAVFVFSGEIEI
ncbi:MAG: diaminopimelate epimerase [Proteobacteria bacterium]|nr:diaminopimelate epimerase [Pseudomonadota bacterium]